MEANLLHPPSHASIAISATCKLFWYGSIGVTDMASDRRVQRALTVPMQSAAYQRYLLSNLVSDQNEPHYNCPYDNFA